LLNIKLTGNEDANANDANANVAGKKNTKYFHQVAKCNCKSQVLNE